MTDRMLDDVRQTIALLLPEVLRRAISSYRDFVMTEAALGAKDFKEHHTAGRAALVHLETMLRLARWAAPGDGGDDNENLERLVGEARLALADMRGGETPDGGDAP
ncbi:MAG: hypothetical protein GC191_05755 [Azospirillum sp.]|nr:hypothetical protein [Azospirillum sp.]